MNDMSVDNIAAEADDMPAVPTREVYTPAQRVGYSMNNGEIDPMSLVDHMSKIVDGVHPGDAPYRQHQTEAEPSYSTGSHVSSPSGELETGELLSHAEKLVYGTPAVKSGYNDTNASYN